MELRNLLGSEAEDFENQTEDDFAVLNIDDPEAAKMGRV